MGEPRRRSRPEIRIVLPAEDDRAEVVPGVRTEPSLSAAASSASSAATESSRGPATDSSAHAGGAASTAGASEMLSPEVRAVLSRQGRFTDFSRSTDTESPPRSPSDVQSRLEAARRQGRVVRRRIQTPSIVVGAVLTMAGILLLFTLAATDYAHAGALLIVPGVLIMLAALMPTDTAVVRLVALLVSVCAAIVGAFYVASALWLQPVELATDGAGRLRCALLAGSAAQPQPSSAARDAEANSSDRDGGGGGSTGAGDQRVRCWAFMASALFLGLLGAIAWALALRTLSDVLRRLPTRALLDHIWAGVGFAYLACALLNVGAVVGYAVAGVRPPPSQLGTMAALTASLCVCGGLAATPGFRRRVHAFLSARGEAVATAAGVSALLGDRTPTEALAIAERNLRCVRADQLDYETLLGNAPSRALYEISRPARLGEIDFFLSHSWSDCPEGKWAALQSWRADFVRAHGREPRLFLDKLCIPPDDIETNLVCLPVFLAACNKLLVLPGDTYLTRLWAVVELYVFLEMGGTLEQIELRTVRCPRRNTRPPHADATVAPEARNAAPAPVPVAREGLSVDGGGGTDEPATSLGRACSAALIPNSPFSRLRRVNAQRGYTCSCELPHPANQQQNNGGQLDLAEACRRFDVRQANTTVAADKERLLTMIENGFGTLRAFNAVARSLLAAALEREEAVRSMPPTAPTSRARTPVRAPRLAPIAAESRAFLPPPPMRALTDDASGALASSFGSIRRIARQTQSAPLPQTLHRQQSAPAVVDNTRKRRAASAATVGVSFDENATEGVPAARSGAEDDAAAAVPASGCAPTGGSSAEPAEPPLPKQRAQREPPECRPCAPPASLVLESADASPR